jgi:plasmid stability protein
MVAMLTDTVAELAGQSDAAVSRLQSIEKDLGRASELDDIRALKTSLGESLRAVREAAAHHRSTSATTMERLRAQLALARARVADVPEPPAYNRDDIDSIPEPSAIPVESRSAPMWPRPAAARRPHRDPVRRIGPAAHADHDRHPVETMLSADDRLLRWKGTSFVMFLNSKESLGQIRGRLSSVVAMINQQYIEVGSKTSLLSIGVDWVVFSQADHPTLEAVFTEVDAFLVNATQNGSPAAVSR